ncbi:MAG: hypothetical protein M3Q77_08580 [Thermoproteota archaeon]|nr:hypothetical protein [Thermoproteota archaeon]
MKNSREKISNDVVEGREDKSREKLTSIERQGSNLIQRKNHDLQTASKILLYMQEEKF